MKFFPRLLQKGKTSYVKLFNRMIWLFKKLYAHKDGSSLQLNEQEKIRKKDYLIWLANLHSAYLENGAYAYLEIGVQRFLSLEKSSAELNIGVDPIFKMRKYDRRDRSIEILIQDFSSNFFSQRKYSFLIEQFSAYTNKFIFIDGDHSAETVLTDIVATANLINDGDFAQVIVHDVLPETEHDVSRSSKYYVGDGYKVIYLLLTHKVSIELINISPSGLARINAENARIIRMLSMPLLKKELERYQDLTVKEFQQYVKNLVVESGKISRPDAL